jgi:predicted metal-dependent phosphoesterase TrpH
MKFLFHLHTHHSYDSKLKPGQIIDFALEKGIGMIAITDHGNMNGSLEAQKIVKERGLSLEIIVGAEYLTDCGDIIGLFLKEEIRETQAEKLIEKIHEQGGLVVLPHPYYHHTLSEALIEKTDMIEVFNARCSEKQNKNAVELAAKYNKPIICGNDAHLRSELTLCVNRLKDQLAPVDSILAKKDFDASYTSRSNILKSQMIKGWKTRNPVLILKTLKSFVSVYIVQPTKKGMR